MKLIEYYDYLCKPYVGHDTAFEFVVENLQMDIPFAFARFNDGEMMGIEKVGAIAARGDQYVNESLHESLIEAIKHRQQNYYVGIPCEICFPHLHGLADDLVGDYTYKVIAMALQNRNWARFMSIFPKAISGKSIRFISGQDQDLTFLKQKLGFKIVDHITYPNIDSWKFYNEIYPYLSKVNQGEVVLLSLGPTARVLTKNWFEEKPESTFLDIGSIFDPFTRNVKHNYHRGWENGFNMGKECKMCN